MAIMRAVRGAGWPLVAALTLAGVLHAQQQQADSAHRAPSQERPATLIGHVTDSLGLGLPGAEITAAKLDQIRVVTGDSGEFRINDIPAGTVVFNVRRIGYEAATFTAVLHSGKIGRATFRLSPTAQPLPTMKVSDTASTTHWLDQFDRRKTNGGAGRFFTRADIEAKGARTGTDIIRSVAGIRLVPRRGGGGSTVLMTRGDGVRSCVPQVFVHNMAYSGSLDDFIADDIEALEVYVGISEIPPEYTKTGKNADCGAIVVWTRDPGKKGG